MTVHTGVWDTTRSLPGQGSVSLNGARDCGEGGVLDGGQGGTAGGDVAGVRGYGRLRQLLLLLLLLLVAHAHVDLLRRLHVYGDGRVAGRPAQGERPNCNDCRRCLGTGCIVRWRMVLWLRC